MYNIFSYMYLHYFTRKHFLHNIYYVNKFKTFRSGGVLIGNAHHPDTFLSKRITTNVLIFYKQFTTVHYSYAYTVVIAV